MPDTQVPEVDLADAGVPEGDLPSEPTGASEGGSEGEATGGSEGDSKAEPTEDGVPQSVKPAEPPVPAAELDDEPAEGPVEPVEPEPAADSPALSEYAHPEVEVAQEVRRHPSTIGGLLFLLVLGSALAGVGISLTGRWRAGIVWIGVALLVGAFFRLVLPESQAGMLHVRRRLVDVALLVVLGGALLITVSIR